MPGLATNIGNVFGGSAAKTDRKNQLAGFGDLNNLFNFGFASGTSETGAAQDQLGQAGSYYSKLLSGDRAATLSAVAPTTNAVNAQSDAAKRQIATSGTARGGGTNATGQSINDQTRAQIDTAVSNAKSGAAKGATEVGNSMASQASNLLGMGTTAASNLTQLAGDSRAESDKLHQQTAKSTGVLAADFLDQIFGGGEDTASSPGPS
jgi:hypothetical protein